MPPRARTEPPAEAPPLAPRHDDPDVIDGEAIERAEILQYDKGVSVYTRMVRVMADVGVIAKKNENKSQGFKFRGIDDAMNALQPVLVRHGLIITPDEIKNARTEVRPTSGGKTMNVTFLTVRFAIHGVDGGCCYVEAVGEAQDSGDKATGKAHSMALKTALLETFMIRTEETAADDPDYYGQQASGPPPGWPQDEVNGFLGSVNVARANRDEETLRTLWARLNSQPYATRDQWDMLNAQLRLAIDAVRAVPDAPLDTDTGADVQDPPYDNVEPPS